MTLDPSLLWCDGKVLKLGVCFVALGVPQLVQPGFASASASLDARGH